MVVREGDGNEIGKKLEERAAEGRFHPGLLPLAGDGQTVK